MAVVEQTQMSNLPAPSSVWIILGPVLLLGVVAVLLSVFARSENRPSDEGWKGIFYSNPDDSALLVPKRYGIGYTLNFGNPWSWVVLALILILIMVPLPFILSISTVHRVR